MGAPPPRPRVGECMHVCRCMAWCHGAWLSGPQPFSATLPCRAEETESCGVRVGPPVRLLPRGARPLLTLLPPFLRWTCAEGCAQRVLHCLP